MPPGSAHAPILLDINRLFPLWHQRIRARAAHRDPVQPAPRVDGFCLAVDCLTAGCRGERTYAITALAGCYDGNRTVGVVLRRMRCANGCGKPDGRSMVGDRANAQRTCPTAPGGRYWDWRPGVSRPDGAEPPKRLIA
jgi:hypothetical protein